MCFAKLFNRIAASFRWLFSCLWRPVKGRDEEQCLLPEDDKRKKYTENRDGSEPSGSPAHPSYDPQDRPASGETEEQRISSEDISTKIYADGTDDSEPSELPAQKAPYRPRGPPSHAATQQEVLRDFSQSLLSSPSRAQARPVKPNTSGMVRGGTSRPR